MNDDIKKGLLGIVVDETEVSKVMPEINSLTYRGYAAQDLCEYCRFEEVAYLILNKDLPNSIELKHFEKEERNNRELTKNLYEIIKHMPKRSHPMDVARTAVSVMGLEDKETTDSSPEANMRKALRIFSKTPTALAAFYRIRKGKKIIKPKKNLTFAENFFYMCFGKVPQKEIVKAFDVSLILYGLGIPLLGFKLLYDYRYRLYDMQDRYDGSTPLSFLFLGYREKRWYYEFIIMGKKAGLIFLSVFLKSYPRYQIIAASLLVQITFFLHVFLRPYDTITNYGLICNRLESISLLSLVKFMSSSYFLIK